MIDPDNWDQVDELFQFLNLPFSIEVWEKCRKLNPQHTLSAYLVRIGGDKSYSTSSWKEENAKWLQAKAENKVLTHLDQVKENQRLKWKQRWGKSYTDDEYKFLDSFFKKILNTQNVSTPILEEYAKDFCELELVIKRKVRNGEDAKKEMDARDNIIKVAGFQAQNSRNIGDFESVGELFTYYAKKGWYPTWHHQDNDIVDKTMTDTQQYLKRIVMGQGNIAEQVEQKKRLYETSKRLEDDYSYTESEDAIEYEDEEAFENEQLG